MKEFIFYNLETKEYFLDSKYVSEKSIEKFNIDGLEIKPESSIINKKTINELLEFKKFCRKNKYKLSNFVYEDSNHQKTNLKSLKSQFKQIENLGFKIEIAIDGFMYLVKPKEYFKALEEIKDLSERINSFKYKGKSISVFEK